MALDGKAKEFAEWLKTTCLKEERHIDIDAGTHKILEGFKKEMTKILVVGYRPDKAKEKSKELTGIVKQNLEKIEKLCDACFYYKITEEEYKNMEQADEDRFPKMGKALSKEAKKLAKALYLELMLRDFTLKDRDFAVLSVVYCAANLCEEWRSSINIGYAYFVGVEGKKYPPLNIYGVLSERQRKTAFYNLIPELASVAPDYFKKL